MEQQGTELEFFTPDRAPFRPWSPPVPAPEDVLEGELEMQIAVLWTSADGCNATGLWRCQPVKIRLNQPFEETLHLVQGALTYSRPGHDPIRMAPGDSMVMARGGEFEFEVHEPSMTFWAIFEDKPIQF
jgi:uncharacterized cupin superfamily protein